jgi:hypothetical protein
MNCPSAAKADNLISCHSRPLDLLRGQVGGVAQAGQPVHQQRAVDAQTRIERDQARTFLRRVVRDTHPQAQESSQIDHAMQATAKVGHTGKPRLRMGHGQHGAGVKDLARLFEWEQHALPRALHRQPGMAALVGLGCLHALRQARLQFAKGFLVGHIRSGLSRTP